MSVSEKGRIDKERPWKCGKKRISQSVFLRDINTFQSSVELESSSQVREHSRMCLVRPGSAQSKTVKKVTLNRKCVI